MSQQIVIQPLTLSYAFKYAKVTPRVWRTVPSIKCWTKSVVNRNLWTFQEVAGFDKVKVKVSLKNFLFLASNCSSLLRLVGSGVLVIDVLACPRWTSKIFPSSNDLKQSKAGRYYIFQIEPHVSLNILNNPRSFQFIAIKIQHFNDTRPLLVAPWPIQ